MSVHPIHIARQHTGRIQQELEVASAELHLTNSALERHIPPTAKKGDVARALAQNAALEEKVSEAAEDLRTVADLLEEEVAERVRLERRLAQVQGGAGG